MKKLIIIPIIVLFLITFVSGNDCNGNTQCNCNDNLVENQIMWYDMSCNNDGLNIVSNNTILDCNGHSIDGSNSEGTYGIDVTRVNNITIKNCVIKDFMDGVILIHSNNNTFNENIIFGNERYGMNIHQSSNNKIFNNNISLNGVGAYIWSNSNYNTLWNNIFTDNEISSHEETNLINNNWNITNLGNFWSDFEDNFGYPNYYLLPLHLWDFRWNGTGIDYHPMGEVENNNLIVYDDFSDEEINEGLWSVSGNFDEYYLDTDEGNYHTQQNNAQDKYVTLEMNKRFQPGDILEYDVNYISGDDNLLSRIWVNNQWGDSGLQTQECEGRGFATGGAIGYWNGLSCVGQNQRGTYHIRIEFLDNSVNAIFRHPNNPAVSYTPIFNNMNPPYRFAVQSRTGGNGVVHFDYDNFMINHEDKDYSKLIYRGRVGNRNILWNLISFNMELEDNSPEVVFSSLGDVLERVVDDEGNYYTPGDENSDLREIDIKESYWIKVRRTSELSLQGYEMIPSRYKFSFNSGQLQGFSYLLDEERPIQEVFNEYRNDIKMIRDTKGNFWYPQRNYDRIRTMKPGEGYEIVALNDFEFRY